MISSEGQESSLFRPIINIFWSEYYIRIHKRGGKIDCNAYMIACGRWWRWLCGGTHSMYYVPFTAWRTWPGVHWELVCLPNEICLPNETIVKNSEHCIILYYGSIQMCIIANCCLYALSYRFRYSYNVSQTSTKKIILVCLLGIGIPSCAFYKRFICRRLCRFSW